MIKTPIVFFGASTHVLPILELIKDKVEIKLIVTTEKEDGAVSKFAHGHNINFVSVKTLKAPEVIVKIKQTNTPVAILASFGAIIPQNVINIFPKGIINIHPSLLPKYRGPTPVQSALLKGDEETGVSIMLLDNKIDHGPVLEQDKVIINPNDTAKDLYQTLFTKGTITLINLLPDYLDNISKPIEQDHKNATYTAALNKQSGYIDIHNPPSKEQINRMIRAYYPWPGVWTILKIRNKNLRVKLLPEQKLQAEGKKPVLVKDFINGYPEAKQWIEKLF